LIMDRCAVCKSQVCKNHKIEFVNKAQTINNGSFKPLTIDLCPNCYDNQMKKLNDMFHRNWLQNMKIDYCIFCGENVKLKFSINPHKYSLIAFNNQASYFLQHQVDCERCKRTFFDLAFIWNYPDSEPTKITDYLRPFSTAMGEIYGAYAEGLMALNAGRYEDAATKFETAGFIEKAKALRDKNRVILHKHITLDVNGMLNLLSQNNYTIPYKCPNCGAIIKLNKDRNANNFLTCEYCNTGLKAIDVEGLIKQFS